MALGCKWSSLNAMGSEPKVAKSKVKKKLRTKLAQQAANGQVWMQ